jgi:hypothetical protein
MVRSIVNCDKTGKKDNSIFFSGVVNRVKSVLDSSYPIFILVKEKLNNKRSNFNGIVDDIDMFMKQLALRDIRCEVYLKV